MRQEPALLRAEVAAAAAGGAATLMVLLRVDCLAFCHGLEFHHTGEDRGVFPAVEARHPEPAESLARRRRISTARRSSWPTC
ncbi:hypothetical protein SRB5_33320 [Streptomyces sp. RB5]|uniref:Hemerythrin-like domain-containing protein n=1 Tax=Streptomyces smaragdinus TaxID=2585196 RepID=A0A7K0CI86_9ACTN|nr:hypothetical protein [Streptomyces smaragdinus]MQY13189.1 hypothetical protein [Streptomyces smaragdinus]